MDAQQQVEKKPEIVVVGSLNMDLVTRVQRLPAGGETMTAESFTTGPGGKGANQAVASARLCRETASSPGSVDVYMVGAVGTDKFGEELVERMEADGIITSQIARLPDQSSGIANIIVEGNGENRIMLAANANGTNATQGYQWTQSDVPKVGIFQLEIPLQMVSLLSTFMLVQKPINCLSRAESPASVAVGKDEVDRYLALS
jgi:ribokinase